MKATVAWGALLLGLISSQAAPFQNLGFDEADTNHVYDPDPFPPLDLFGTVSEMLPGWQLFLGTNAETRVGLNTTLPGVGYASLMDSNCGAPGYSVGCGVNRYRDREWMKGRVLGRRLVLLSAKESGL